MGSREWNIGQIGRRTFPGQETSEQEAALLRLHGRTGKPFGSDEFIGHLEKMISRRLRRKKPGPKKKSDVN
jgi:hypothetical protein